MTTRKGSWAWTAEKVIREVLADAKESGLSPKETIKAVDAAYPFCERSMWPYKMWLKVRREMCQGMPRVSPLKMKKNAQKESFGDDMFEVNE